MSWTIHCCLSLHLQLHAPALELDMSAACKIMATICLPVSSQASRVEQACDDFNTTSHGSHTEHLLYC